MNTNSTLESLKFRLHVRNLLYDYFKQHCTKDYLTFTEDLLSEVQSWIEAALQSFMVDAFC